MGLENIHRKEPADKGKPSGKIQDTSFKVKTNAELNAAKPFRRNRRQVLKHNVPKD